MSLPTIVNPTPIQISAKEFPNYYIVEFELNMSRLRIKYRPYNQETGELIDTTSQDIKIEIPNIWAYASQYPNIADVMADLVTESNLILQRDIEQKAEQLTIGVIE